MELSRCKALLDEMFRRYGNSLTFQGFLERHYPLTLGYRCELCRGPDLGPIVKDDLWLRIVGHHKDTKKRLCQKCMELALYRPLKNEDYLLCPWNVLRGNQTIEGEMANRGLQQKRLKMIKDKRKKPKALPEQAIKVSRYNSTSPYAMGPRKFPSPDSDVMEKTEDRISAEVIFDKPPTEFNSVSLAKVHSGLDRSKGMQATAYQVWRNWRRTGKTVFVMVNKIDRRINRIDLLISGQQYIYVEEHYVLKFHRVSITYTKDRAEQVWRNDDITWEQTLPLETS